MNIYSPSPHEWSPRLRRKSDEDGIDEKEEEAGAPPYFATPPDLPPGRLSRLRQGDRLDGCRAATGPQDLRSDPINAAIRFRKRLSSV